MWVTSSVEGFVGGTYWDLGVSKNRGIPKMDGFLRENPIKMDDLGVPLFSETSISVHVEISYGQGRFCFLQIIQIFQIFDFFFW